MPKKKKRVQYRIGPAVPKKILLKQLAKKRHLKLIINDGKNMFNLTYSFTPKFS